MLLYATLFYATLLYASLRYSTQRCSTLLYATLRYSTLLYATIPYSTLLYATQRMDKKMSFQSFSPHCVIKRENSKAIFDKETFQPK
jgi:hypothetical protein